MLQYCIQDLLHIVFLHIFGLSYFYKNMHIFMCFSSVLIDFDNQELHNQEVHMHTVSTCDLTVLNMN